MTPFASIPFSSWSTVILMRLTALSVCLLPFAAIACGSPASATSPSPLATTLVQSFALEAEAGSGDGDLMQRSHASGALTIHLAPGQRRQWTFEISSPPSQYNVFVTYSNDNPGETEVLKVAVDGESIGTIRTQDTGDDGEGWNIFVADLAGAAMLRPGTHTVTVESAGGDGCIEIDMVTIRPDN
jgi:hypothetical protein